MSFFFDRSLIGAKRRSSRPDSEARARGLRFERKITDLLLQVFEKAEAQVPICATNTGSVVAIPDLLMPLPNKGMLVVEVKQNFFPENKLQIEKYKSLLTAMGYEVRMIVICSDFYAPSEAEHLVTGCREMIAAIRGARDYVVCVISARELKLVSRGLLDGVLGAIREANADSRGRRFRVGSRSRVPSYGTETRKGIA